MQPILTQSQQFPDRTAAVKRAIGQVPLSDRFRRALQTPVIATSNTRCDRFDWRDAIDQDRPFTDEEHKQLCHLLELAGRITGAVIQPGDIGSRGPMFSGDSQAFNDGYSRATGIDQPAPAYPPANIADSTTLPAADFQAQAETGTGHAGEVPPPDSPPSGSGGMFNPQIELDTSNTSIAPMPRGSARRHRSTHD